MNEVDRAKLAPVALTNPDGVVVAYACPRCGRVCGSGGFVEEVDRVDDWREDAARCCLCRECGVETARGDGIECRPCRERKSAEWFASPAYAELQAQQEASAETFNRSPDPDAARQLAELMSSISEDHFCAGWMSGTEHRLWQMVEGGDREWMGPVEESEVAQLKALSDKCGGWIVYGDGGEEFVSIEEWRRRSSGA